MSETSNTNVKMPMELKKELKKIAIDEDTSLSGLILKMIYECVEARKQKNNDKQEIKNRF